MKIALIPTGSCEWAEKGRLLGRVELEMSAAGEQACDQWGRDLAALGLGKIFHAPDGLSKRTAKLVNGALDASTKSIEALEEVDVGLWAGLTEEQLRERFAKAHRELCDAPLNVRPPEGEEFSAAAKRVQACLMKQIGRNGKAGVAFVLRPLAFAIAKCALTGEEPSGIWCATRGPSAPIIIDQDSTPPAEKAS